MKIDVLTIFPGMFDSIKASVLGRAIDKGLINLNVIDIRKFSKNKHKKVDDYPYGGGPGMLMTVQPLHDAIMSVKNEDSYTVFLTPAGITLNQKKVVSISKNIKHLIIICGHYEGVDQRVIDLHVDDEISIGDYVLTGGEIPAMVIVDSIVRNIEGVLSNPDSLSQESFSEKRILEHPQYTRPKVFKGLEVPKILVSGDHSKIKKWQENKAYEKTLKNRPDLIYKDDKNEN